MYCQHKKWYYNTNLEVLFMGFTIQDMLILSKDQYQMELIAGKNGWSNSISWALMLEDIATINHFA